MKLFVSKKDETMVVLSAEEELEAGKPKKEPSDPKNAYWFGEVLLGFISFLLVAAGVFPQFTIDKLWDVETKEEISHVNPGKSEQKVIMKLPIKVEKDWILRRKK